MVVSRPSSQACVLCDAHVPTGEQRVVLRAVVRGEGEAADVKEVVGPMCSDGLLCAARTFDRAVGVELERNEFQTGLRRVVRRYVGRLLSSIT